MVAVSTAHTMHSPTAGQLTGTRPTPNLTDMIHFSTQSLLAAAASELANAEVILATTTWTWEGHCAQLAAADLAHLHATVSGLAVDFAGERLHLSTAIQAERDLLTTSLVGAL